VRLLADPGIPNAQFRDSNPEQKALIPGLEPLLIS